MLLLLRKRPPTGKRRPRTAELTDFLMFERAVDDNIRGFFIVGLKERFFAGSDPSDAGTDPL